MIYHTLINVCFLQKVKVNENSSCSFDIIFIFFSSIFVCYRKWRQRVYKGCNNTFDNRYIILSSMLVFFRKWKWMKIVVAVLILAIYFSHPYLFAIESEGEDLTAAITVLSMFFFLQKVKVNENSSCGFNISHIFFSSIFVCYRKWRWRVNSCNNSFDNSHIILSSMFFSSESESEWK